MVEGERLHGRYVLLIDDEGRKHALSKNSIIGVSEVDCDGDECIVQLPGGRMLRVRRPIDIVLDWLG